MSMTTIYFHLRSPMSHGDPALTIDTGNFRAFRRQMVLGVGQVPVLSGNAIRGVLRRALMRHFLEAAGMTPAAYECAAGHWDRIYAALCNGGTLVGSEKAVNTKQLRDLRAAVPPLSLLGSALYTYMLPGMISMLDAYPQCRELAAAGFTGPSDLSIADLCGDRHQVRHVSAEVDRAATGITPMPYSFEVIYPGVVLQGGVIIDRQASQIERDCLAYGLSLIHQLGGATAKGMGMVEIVVPEPIGDAASYAAWVSEYAPAARAAIDQAIPSRLERA